MTPPPVSAGFHRVGGRLHCAAVPLDDLAERFGTPLYVYDLGQVEARVQAFREAFQGVPFTLAYSVKANGNLSVLNRLAALGCGADIVSAGELHRCVQAGIEPHDIYFAGVGKRREEMERALEVGVGSFHVESAAELELLGTVAGDLGVEAPVGIRVNPDILSPTFHEYTRTGHAASKFGVPVAEALELYDRAADHPHLRVRGVDVHIGSQILDPAPYMVAWRAVQEMVALLRDRGIPLEYVDLGGGFGVGYRGEPGLDLAALAQDLAPQVAEEGLDLVLEPGRSVVAEAGVLLVRVLHVKRSGGKVFVVADGGMTELLRPSHYDGFHAVEPVQEWVGRTPTRVDLVGPICESGDFLARDRELPLPEAGELLAVRAAGAYGFSMASNYNARRRPAEVAVWGDRVHLARERESYDDLIRGESLPHW
jgi:diaminopimelate decarboxylase